MSAQDGSGMVREEAHVNERIETYLRSVAADGAENDEVQTMLPYWAKVRPEDLRKMLDGLDALRAEVARLTRERDEVRAQFATLERDVWHQVNAHDVEPTTDAGRAVRASIAAGRAACDERNAARAKALDEAAAECWRASDELADRPDMLSEQGAAQRCATRILALKEPTR